MWVLLPITLFDLCRLEDSHGTVVAALLAGAGGLAAVDVPGQGVGGGDGCGISVAVIAAGEERQRGQDGQPEREAMGEANKHAQRISVEGAHVTRPALSGDTCRVRIRPEAQGR